MATQLMRLGKHKPTWETYNGQNFEMRQEGATLQRIADKVDRTREWVRQLLVKHYGSTKLTRISDEEIGYAVLSVAVRDQWCFRGDTLEDNLPSYQAIAQAQLRKDQKVLDAYEREAQIILTATLSILVREVQDCKSKGETNKLLHSWIDANDLKPELVETYSSLEELKQALKEKMEEK